MNPPIRLVEPNMTKTYRWISILVAVLLAGCATQAQKPAASAIAGGPVAAEDNINATLWLQSSAEYRALALQTWRQAGPAFDTSLALEFMGFGGPDVREGVASLRERRPPKF